MAELILNSLTNKVFRLPVIGCRINSNDGPLILYHPESESNCKFTPITRSSDIGSILTLAYKIEANLYFPFNRFRNTNLLDKLESIRNEILANGKAAQILLFFGPKPLWAEQAPTNLINTDIISTTIDFGTNNYQNFAQPSFSYEIEYIEFRLRLVLHLFAIIRQPLFSWANSPFIYEKIQGDL